MDTYPFEHLAGRTIIEVNVLRTPWIDGRRDDLDVLDRHIRRDELRHRENAGVVFTRNGLRNFHICESGAAVSMWQRQIQCPRPFPRMGKMAAGWGLWTKTKS